MALLQRYQAIRAYTEHLCAPLQIEDYLPQPEAFVSPPKWHLAHVTWFFETMILLPHKSDYSVFDPSFGYLFNSYYNALGERSLRCHRGLMSRPSVNDVMAYRRYVDDAMRDFLRVDLGKALTDLIELGLQHEQQHQELLITDLKFTFSFNPTFPVYQEGFCFVDDGASTSDKNHDADTGQDTDALSAWLSVDAGLYDIGHCGSGFCFDNELGRHSVYLSDFSLRQTLVSNSEFMAFMDEGGYDNPLLWLDDAWAWLQQSGKKHPLYWHQREDTWHYYTLSGLRPVHPKAPISHISYYEAQAFATWAQYRLPTEFEWEVAAPRLRWGQRWEWTDSAYLPYPKFSTRPGAVGEYNGKFMVNQMVLRGASLATPESHRRITYRNFFHPHHQWQLTGIRLAH